MLFRSPLVVALLLATSACAPSFGKGLAPLPSPMLVSADNRPALFIRPQADSALVGYVADDVPLELAGSIEQGRVPVRIEGALRARGYVPLELLRLRVQRRGRVRGTPVYVGPGDRVRVLGDEPGSPDRLRVEVTAHLAERELGRYQGSYPRVGLAARTPDSAAEAPDVGVAYQVPAQLPIPLFELPGGPVVAQLDAQPVAYEVRAVSEQAGWLAIRAGTGPYLIGWTNLSLVRLDPPPTQLSAATSAGPSAPATSAGPSAPSTSAEPSAAATPSTTSPSATSPVLAPIAQPDPGDQVPARLLNEPGELRRVVAHSKVVFGEQVIGVFKTMGWARVISVYPTGFADVFAAADDRLAIRGLMRMIDLIPLPPATSPPDPAPLSPVLVEPPQTEPPSGEQSAPPASSN